MNLKIKFYVPLILFLISHNVYSNKIKLGLQTGINFSTISATNAPDEFSYGKGFLPAYVIGLTSEYYINSEYGFISEINYSIKGYKMDILGIKVRSYSNYLEVPLRLKYKQSQYLAIEFGPYFGIALSEYLKNNLTKSKVAGNIGNKINNEPPDTLKPFDFGFQMGVSYNLNKFIIGGFLSYGVLNTRPGGGSGSSVRNLTTQLKISYDLINFDE